MANPHPRKGGRRPLKPESFSGGTAGLADRISPAGIPQTHHKGVHWFAKRGNWVAQLWWRGRNLSVGNYDTPEEAAEARLALRRDLLAREKGGT